MEQRTDTEPSVLEQRKAIYERGELQRELAKGLVAPKALEAVAALLASPAMQQVLAIQELLVDKVIRPLQKPEVRAAIEVVVHRLHAIALSPEMAETIRTVGQLNRALEQMSNSPLAAYLASGRGPNLDRLVEGAGAATITVQATGEGRVITGKELELERQIVSHLERGEPVSSLPIAQRLHLNAFINFLKLLVMYLAAQNGVREELCFLQDKLPPTVTMNQAVKSVRAAMCESGVPVDFLSGYRMVKGHGVNLRTDPGMKAPTVQVTLVDRALLEVLDNSNRDWLHVQVVGNDGAVGWVSRKYTHPLQ